MKVLIVYDSFFGNTEKIAKAVSKGLENCNMVRVDDFKDTDLTDVEVLVVGSPTRGFRPSENVQSFLKSIPSLEGIWVASFDTRINTVDIGSTFLSLMVKLFGYAAEPIDKRLKSKGGEETIKPEGFYVKDREGPLVAGEEERAMKWGQSIATTVGQYDQ